MILTETISVWELAWTILAGIGLILHIALVVDALRDKAALLERIKAGEARKDGPRYTLANLNIVEDLSRALLQVVFLLIGVIAMSRPPNPAPSDGAAYLPGVLILLSEVVLITVSVYGLRSRYRIIRQMRSYIFQAGLPNLAPGAGTAEQQSVIAIYEEEVK